MTPGQPAHRRVLRPRPEGRLLGMYGVLTVMNVGAWAWALIAFHGKPAMPSRLFVVSEGGSWR